MNQVTKAPTTAVSVAPLNLGASNDVTVSDLQISRLKILQANSDLVKEGDSKPGSVIDVDTNDVKAMKGEKPLKFIIVGSKKTWLIEENGTYQVLPATHKNEYPWNENGIKRTYFHSFFVLLPDDVNNGNPFPYELSFSSTGLTTAAMISKHLLLQKHKMQPSWCLTFEANVILRKKGKNSWYSLQVTKTSLTSAEHQKLAESFSTLNYASKPEVTTQHSEEEAF